MRIFENGTARDRTVDVNLRNRTYSPPALTAGPMLANTEGITKLKSQEKSFIETSNSNRRRYSSTSQEKFKLVRKTINL